jgi:hypothetical protein
MRAATKLHPFLALQHAKGGSQALCKKALTGKKLHISRNTGPLAGNTIPFKDEKKKKGRLRPNRCP